MYRVVPVYLTPFIYLKSCKCIADLGICEKNSKEISKSTNNCRTMAKKSKKKKFPRGKRYADYCPTIGMKCLTTEQKMCECASKENLCGKTCEALFDSVDSDCQGYASQQVCGGVTFPLESTYTAHCPTIGMKCLTTEQKMCECASKENLCGETCEALFDSVDLDCQGYAEAGQQVCGGGTFPLESTYTAHCPTIGMKCCQDSSSWKLDGRGCDWVSKKPTKRCNKESTGAYGSKANEKGNCDRSCRSECA